MSSHTTWNSYACFLSFPASANRQALFHRFSYHNESQRCFICFPVSVNHQTCSSSHSTAPQIITNHVPSVHLSQRIIKMFHLFSCHRELQNWLMSQRIPSRFHPFPCQLESPKYTTNSSTTRNHQTCSINYPAWESLNMFHQFPCDNESLKCSTNSPSTRNHQTGSISSPVTKNHQTFPSVPL